MSRHRAVAPYCCFSNNTAVNGQ